MSPFLWHHDRELRPVDGDGDGDLSCGHHRTGTMAIHWVSSIFLSASPHLHFDDDTNDFAQDSRQLEV